MLIISDNRMPENAKIKLNDFGEFVGLKTQNIVYEAISGHTDIFLHYCFPNLVYAPQLPSEYLDRLAKCNLNLIEGEKPLGKIYPETAVYNVAFTKKHFIGNSRINDVSINIIHSNRSLIHVNQGYTACNLVVGDHSVLCSDQGIANALKMQNYDVEIINPKEIQLWGMSHGFIGGCLSVYDGKLFVTGSLKFAPEPQKISRFAEVNNLTIIELYNGPLVDCGGILFLPVK